MNYLPYVNIRMGTDSKQRFSHGNTLPLTQLPWAMAGFVPQTDGAAGGWFFHSGDRAVEGIRLTHQPSPWINDYGTFVMTPQNDRIFSSYRDAWTGYRPEETTFRPDRLTVRFLRQRCTFDLVPTERGGVFTLHFDMLRGQTLSFFPLKGENTWEFDAETNTLFGKTTGHSQDKPKDFCEYIAVRFAPGTVDAEKSASFAAGEAGKGFHVVLTGADTAAQLAISYLSFEQALANLAQDCGNDDFGTLAAKAEERWETLLHRIEIETDDEEQKKTFYSCLYRTFLFPHKAYEIDCESGKPVHYSPFDGKKKPGVRYTDNGFWDTYRTVYPLYALIARDEYAEILDGFVADYRDGGWLPRWPSLGEVGCMPSTLIDAVIADAAVKGIGRREVWADALEGMLHHANHNGPEDRYGRNGAELYCKIGYVPGDRYRESVNLTLDAAYGDYCIAQVAKVLGQDDLVPAYLARSKNYAKLFDPETGFMRARTEKGAMAAEFDPYSWGGDYTEGSAWQSSFAVPHDIAGLAQLYGGTEKLLAKLDDLFAAEPIYRTGGYGGEIHEMTEMAAQDFGQCAISNQPSFHLPFLYSLLGREDTASTWVKRLCTAFSSKNDGYPGDEDNGTMSAWYIFACLGIYPVCPGMPGTDGYAKTDMLVSSAKLCGKEWNHDHIEEYL